MSATTPPDLPPKRGGLVRCVVWLAVWAAGTWLTGVSAMRILADSHRWDARLPISTRAKSSAPSTATFRTLSGGTVNVLATSYVSGNVGRKPFQGAIAISIRDGDDAIVREYVLGRGGIAHEQTGDSSWSTLGQITAPRLWLNPWRFEARSLEPDASFPAGQIEVMLRKQREELGMGGMVYYVTIFIGAFLLLVATAIAAAWRSAFTAVPLVVSIATLIATVAFFVV